MKRICVVVILGSIAMLMHAQIVADHTAVDQYDQIPQQYINAVKTMLVSIPGESHASGYRIGQNLLEQMDPTCQVETYWDFDPPAATDQYLRLGMHRQAGEDFFFSQTRIAEMKGEISDQNATGNPFHVMGFAWCWDMTDGDAPGGTIDPVFQVHWAGRSEGGPEGSMRWGLDADDQVLTGNSVCMDTYLEAVESYIQFCTENSYPTQWIFTTGPVDKRGGTENGFQREIKHDYIRDYVAADPDRILFDYADILCWNNNGVQYMADWDDGGNIRSHADMHPDNRMDYDDSWNLISPTEDGDHIGEVGAVRLAKAMWWLLARMAGWDPGATSVEPFDGDDRPESALSVYVGSELLRVDTSAEFEQGDLGIFDMTGRMVESANIQGNHTLISTSSLSQGTYIVRVSKDDHMESRKVLLIR